MIGIGRHKATNGSSGFRPDPARLLAAVTAQLGDEAPISQRLAPEGAFGDLMPSKELLYLGQERMIVHNADIARVAARTQAKSAGGVPLLREGARPSTIGAMTEPKRIDVPRLRRDVLEWLEANPDETRRGLSLAASAGRNPDVIRDLFRVDKRMPTYATVAALAEAIGQAVSRYVDVETSPAQPTTWLTVTGAVAAGVWREQVEWAGDDWYQVEILSHVPENGEIGLIVEGRSMDRTLPPGTILRCVPLIGSGHEIQDGDYVIVEQARADLKETTCKRLSRRPDGDWELRAESYLPEFQQPMHIGKPTDGFAGAGFDMLNDDETRVKALVLDAHLPLQRRQIRRIAN